MKIEISTRNIEFFDHRVSKKNEICTPLQLPKSLLYISHALSKSTKHYNAYLGYKTSVITKNEKFKTETHFMNHFCLLSKLNATQNCYKKYKKMKFIYSDKATKFFEISTLLLSYVVPVKRKVEILQNFVAFSEYINFRNHTLL